MKIKSNLLIACKMIVVGALIWYLPTKVGEGLTIINAATQGQTIGASSDKRIHIYNTHQTEEYIDYDVVAGATYLRDSLHALGYECDVEDNSIPQYLHVNNLTYDESYVASKAYLEQKLESSGPYDLIIDVHRDSVDKNLSTITHDGVSYAKVMFVVGQSSGKYENVNQISTAISDLMNTEVPGISRGIYEKQSHYNQGVSDNIILIEIGAHENTKEEVQNTVDVLTEVLHAYLSQ